MFCVSSRTPRFYMQVYNSIKVNFLTNKLISFIFSHDCHSILSFIDFFLLSVALSMPWIFLFFLFLFLLISKYLHRFPYQLISYLNMFFSPNIWAFSRYLSVVDLQFNSVVTKENDFYGLNYFKFVRIILMTQSMIQLLNSPYILELNVYSDVLGRMFYKYQSQIDNASVIYTFIFYL